MTKFKKGDIVCNLYNGKKYFYTIKSFKDPNYPGKETYDLISFPNKLQYNWTKDYTENNCRLAVPKEIEELKIKSIVT